MENKIKLTIAAAILALITFSFGGNAQEVKTINTDESKVVWKGYKVTGSHEGTIEINSGELSFKDEVLVGGTVEIDMTTISSTDLSGEYKDKLDGHLKSDDFFGVATYPKAKIVFTDVKSSGKNAYAVTGDLTIKGQTHPISFTFSIYGSKGTASLKIDRTKYDIRYGSNSFFDDLKDKAIYDEFDIVADLQF